MYIKNTRVFKKILCLLVCLVATFVFQNKTLALKATQSYRLSDGETFFRYKTIDGTPAYCLDMTIDSPVETGANLTKVDGTTKGYTDIQLKTISAIIAGANKITSVPNTFSATLNDNPSNNLLDNYRYFVAEMAINKYLGTRTSFDVSSTTKNYIDTLSSITLPTNPLNLNIQSSNNTIQNLNSGNIINEYVQSELIKIELNDSNVDFSITTSGVEGVKILDSNGEEKSTFKGNGEFMLLIPVSNLNVNGTTTVNYNITASNSYTTYLPATVYAPDTANTQNLVLVGDVTTQDNALNQSFKLDITLNTTTIISKVDVTNGKELKGATLQVQDVDGNIVELNGNKLEWVSTDKPYKIEGLPVGKYYLVETIAPKGYELNKEKVLFEVKGDGTATNVVMKNQLEVEVPDTLSSRSALLLTIAMFDIALGIGIITYVKKNKFQE